MGVNKFIDLLYIYTIDFSCPKVVSKKLQSNTKGKNYIVKSPSFTAYF